MMRLRFAALLALSLSSAAFAETPPAEPSSWLAAISDAARTSNYQGVVVYRDGEMLETMKIAHRFQGGEERERLVSMTGEAREILRRNERVTCILPAARKIMVDHQANKGIFPVMSQDMVMGLSQHYNFRDLGTARVAGRVCRGMHITPQDGYRYGYEVCADEERKVPLRVSLMDRRGRVLEQLMFTEITFPAGIADAALESQLDTRGFQQVTHEVAKPDEGATRWVLQKMPPGFRLKMRDLRTLPGTQGTVEHLLLSDGLSMVSVFSASRAAPERTLKGPARMGGMNAYGRTVGPFHITVVGEVPKETVKLIGDSLLAPADAASAKP